MTGPIGGADFAAPHDDRYFEDYIAGEAYTYGSVTLDEASIVAFARQYDPQPFHIDPVAAKDSIYGGLIASGWQTVAETMRILVDHVISPASSLGSPGCDELRWLEPVRPGDTLSVRFEIDSAPPLALEPGPRPGREPAGGAEPARRRGHDDADHAPRPRPPSGTRRHVAPR